MILLYGRKENSMADEEKTIIERVVDGTGFNDSSFNSELLIHINVAAYDLYQNGVIYSPVIKKETKLSDLKSEAKDEEQIISYFTLHAKLYVDSPAPSMVQSYHTALSKILDRLSMERSKYDQEKEVSK